MRILTWIIRGFFFFALFAFALNNRQEVLVHWFFGRTWQAPLVFVVFAAFAAGCAVGLVAMTPAWWRRRQVLQRQSPAGATTPHSNNSNPSPASATTPLPSGLDESELALARSPREAL